MNEGPFYTYTVKKSHKSNKNTNKLLGGYHYDYRTEARNYYRGEK